MSLIQVEKLPANLEAERLVLGFLTQAIAAGYLFALAYLASFVTYRIALALTT